MVPPPILDIDGALTDAGGHLDPRAFEVLPAWDTPVILATGKAFLYPASLCHYLGLPQTVIAENGGVVLTDGEVTFTGDREAAWAAADEFVAHGGNLSWDAADTMNHWRETEIIARLSADEALSRAVASEFDVEVIDTDFTYHIKAPGVEKGVGLERVCETMDYDPEDFVAVGDSVNGASTFRTAGRSYTVANADDIAKEAAGTVLDRSYMDGTLSMLDSLREEDAA